MNTEQRQNVPQSVPGGSFFGGLTVAIYSGTFDKGPSDIRTTSLCYISMLIDSLFDLQGTKSLVPWCPLFGGSTVVHCYPVELVKV